MPRADSRPDEAEEELLDAFRSARLAEGASLCSVRREVSQLRALTREAGTPDRPIPLAALVADPALAARALREPRASISQATGRARLLALQRFVALVGPGLGRNPDAYLDALDALLPARRDAGWHAAGAAVAGDGGRRRRRGPTLEPADLERIVATAAEGVEPARATRDRALVALACFSGLRPEELAALRWEDLSLELNSAGYFGLTARVQRGDRPARLLLAGPARDAVEDLAAAAGRPLEAMTGPLFPARGRPDRPLGYRAAREVLRAACRRAGVPPASGAELRAACAYWLRTRGLSDHEVKEVLGLIYVRSVDRLLARHAAIDAQRRAREVLDL